jgi:HAE1 family hydrophobic/amphiphilic exporter-1
VQWLAEISVRRPVFAWVMILVVMVTGIVGFLQLGVDRFPKVDFPVAVVITAVPGAAPEEIESEVTDRIEERVGVLSGVDEMRSTSSEGLSTVVVTFVLEKDVDVAVQEVRDAIAGVERDLPTGAQAPIVQKFDPDAVPILMLGVDGDVPMRELTELVDEEVVTNLESVDGVGGVTMIGGTPRRINVWLDPTRLAAQGLVATDVQQAIARESVAAPAGPLDDGRTRVSVRLEGRVTSVEQLGAIALREVGGHRVLLRDVAEIEDGAVEAETAAQRDGKSAVVLAIRKQSGANTIEVVDAIDARLEEIRAELPEGFRVDVLRDNAESTRTALHAIYEHILLGGVFAAVVVLMFLGSFRSTFISALAIPTSVVGTFGLLWVAGQTLNTISMLALALSVGIVIDDAIVVLENIHRYIHEEKVKPFPAAILATREIGLAVLATTLSLVAVFLPVAFMGGIPGRFLASFGYTMTFAVLVSLFVSFTLTPMLSARLLKPHREDGKKPVLERLSDAFTAPIEWLYVRVLGFFVRWRIFAIGVAAVTFASVIPFGMLVPKGFLPKSDEAQIEITVRAPEGTSLAQTELVASRLADAVRVEVPEVEAVLLTVGSNERRAVNEAAISVRLVSPETRDAAQDDVIDRIRRDIAPRAPEGVLVKVGEAPLFGGGAQAQPIQLAVTGPDIEGLAAVSQRVVTTLRGIEGAVDVDSTLILGRPEVQLRVDRERAGDLGVAVGSVASTLQIALGGLDVATYPEGGEQYDVHLRSPPQARRGVDDLSDWQVPSSQLGRVPLTQVVDWVEADGPSAVERYNRERYVLVSANLAPGFAQSQIQDAFTAELAKEPLPDGYEVAPFGRSRELAKLLRSFALAFGMSIVFMYLVLAAQFESWVHPFTILLSLPLTVPFALASAWILGYQLDIYTMLGILVLFGVVKKNSILQVDRIIQLRLQGLSRTDAVLRGSRDRLRPILMTTVAFVVGMLPLLFADGVGAGLSRAIAAVVVGGQSLSLVLTLIVTPVGYTLVDDVVRGFRWVGQRLGVGTPASLTGRDEIEPAALAAVAATVSKAHAAAGGH